MDQFPVWIKEQKPSCNVTAPEIFPLPQMKVGSTELIIKHGDITKEKVDAIVTAANSTLSGGGGVDSSVHRMGGPSIMAECKQIIRNIKRVETGDTVITEAGRLQAKWVIHAVGPIWSGGKKGEAELLESAYYNSLLLAKDYGAESVAFPAISCGAYNYPFEQAARIALLTCAEFCREKDGITEIRFVLFTPEDRQVYENLATELLT